MSSKPFQFKQFSVSQDKCAMKIGTDGVLLGAWAKVKIEPQRILDVGTGTGVIALQLAQRFPEATVDAIEINDNAFEQATQNFEDAPWGDRLFCFHGPFQDYTQELLEDESMEGYDLIVSNPPFYTDNYKPEDKARATARFTNTLPFQHLLICVSSLLQPEGVFAVIIPYKEKTEFVKLAGRYEMYLNRSCEVKGTETSEIKRVLLQFSFEKQEIKREALIIEKERHEYTQEYIALVQDFYLKM